MKSKSFKIIPATEVTSEVVTNKQKRVCAYIRVSTQAEQQRHSLESQYAHYLKYISDNPDWELVNIYSDFGVTGMKITSRLGFQEMLTDCHAGKIDIILTKSISRFGRNTVNTISTIRELSNIGVSIYFERENINTLDETSEFVITLLSSLAQEESRSLSNNIKWGKRRRLSQGYYSFVGLIPYGFRLDSKRKKLIIHGFESKIVKFINLLFLQKKSPNEIARYLNSINVPSPQHANWTFGTVKRIIEGEIYRGDVLRQKTYAVDYLTGKTKKNNGELPKFLFSGVHEPIISPLIFDYVSLLAQSDRMLRRSRFSFGNLLVCQGCGSKVIRIVIHSTTYNDRVWICKRSREGKNHCNVPYIYEEYLKEIIRTQVFQKYQEVTNDLSEIILDSVDFTNLFDKQVFAEIMIVLDKIEIHADRLLIIYWIDGSTQKVKMNRNTRERKNTRYTMREKVCPWCENKFQAKGKQKYCSEKCKNSFNCFKRNSKLK